MTGTAVIQIQTLAFAEVFRRGQFGFGSAGLLRVLCRNRRVAAQEFDVGRDGFQVIIGHVCGTVFHHRRHFAANCRFVITSFAQIIDDFLLIPVRDAAQGRDVPVIQAAARQEIRVAAVQRFLVHTETARSMATAAVTQTFHQIRAAVYLLRSAPDWLERLIRGKRPVPETHAPALAEREAQIRFRWLFRARFYTLHKVNVERVHIFVVNFGVIRIRHRRIQTGTVRQNTFAYRIGELRFGIPANAVVFIRRNVGRINGAQIRVDRQSAGKRRFARYRMARAAVAQTRHVFALFDQRCVTGLCVGIRLRIRHKSCTQQQGISDK